MLRRAWDWTNNIQSKVITQLCKLMDWTLIEAFHRNAPSIVFRLHVGNQFPRPIVHLQQRKEAETGPVGGGDHSRGLQQGDCWLHSPYHIPHPMSIY